AGHYTPGILGEEMKLKLPEVKYAANMAWNENSTFEVGDKILKEEGNFAGPDFFSIFSFNIIEGTPESALATPLTIAISKKMANDFFGSPANALGKGIRYENSKDLVVGAVFDNIGPNSTKQFDFIMHWDAFLEGNEWAKDWGNNGPSTYLVLNDGSDVEAFRAKIKDFISLYHKEDNWRTEIDIQKYSDIYLHSNFENGELSGGRIQYVYLFSVIAVFILSIACINFMNLCTARSIKRAKEIGIRKVVGAFRSALIRQFIGEAMFTVVLAMIAALILIVVVLPTFNTITQKQIVLPFTDPSFWIAITLLALFTGLLSGSYPAFYLSSFKPAGVLKGSFSHRDGVQWFRKGLVVFQFVLSIILIIGTIVISNQVSFVQSANLGYDRENLIRIPIEGTLREKYQLFKELASTKPGIEMVSKITNSPTSIYNSTGGVFWEGKDPASRLQFVQTATGYDFMNLMKMQILDGRDFSKERASDSVGYIVNEAAVKVFNYKDPVGKPLTFWGKAGTIVGVVKDFHFTSLHDPIRPLVIRLGENLNYGIILVKTQPGKTKEALESLGQVCRELNPKFPFTYEFLDEEYQNLYKSEQVVGKLADAFAFLGIFISCLGLLGLAMFTAQQRVKEIGIRKVLGAGAGSLFNLLSREMLILVMASLVIAAPIGWIAMNKWLEEYAYRVNISAWTLVEAGVLVFVIALSTISFQAFKAVRANPVESLRTE
ncbi:MAG TPA: FtsX-like permease family protein, partial [Cyclobacteriaceae bacterium]|nr:FtsX-like permease family protein [Cyclobacteriaceae bacterium]